VIKVRRASMRAEAARGAMSETGGGTRDHRGGGPSGGGASPAVDGRRPASGYSRRVTWLASVSPRRRSIRFAWSRALFARRIKSTNRREPRSTGRSKRSCSPPCGREERVLARRAEENEAGRGLRAAEPDSGRVGAQRGGREPR